MRNDGAPALAGAPGEDETDMGSRPGTSAGSGLAGLRERLAAHDGTLEAGPAPGEGTFQLTARVPLPPPGAGSDSDLLDTTENEAA